MSVHLFRIAFPGILKIRRLGWQGMGKLPVNSSCISLGILIDPASA